MNYKEAQEQLRHALQHQKTISINKLSRILQVMNISLKKNNDSMEVKYLKGEIKKSRREIKNNERHVC